MISSSKYFATELSNRVRRLPSEVKLFLGLIIVGQIFGLIISPNFSKGLEQFFSLVVFPVVIIGLVFVYYNKLKDMIIPIVGLLSLVFITVVVIGQSYEFKDLIGVIVIPMAILLFSKFKRVLIKWKVILAVALILVSLSVGILAIKDSYSLAKTKVSMALFEIYPISGLGFDGYGHHFQKNAEKITDPSGISSIPPANILYMWWSTGGMFGLIGFLGMVTYLIKRTGLHSIETLSFLSLLIFGLVTNWVWSGIFVALLGVYYLNSFMKVTTIENESI